MATTKSAATAQPYPANSDASPLSSADTASGRLQRIVLELLREHERDGTLPTSTRFLFYELEQRGVLSKAAAGARRPDQNLQEAVTRLREAGLVPWAWISDETRALRLRRTAPSVREYLLDAVELARLDPWPSTAPAPILLVESRSLMGVLDNLAMEYCAPLASTNGQAHGFLMTEVLPQYRFRRRVLYLGDLDRSGNLIEAHTKVVLERHGGTADMWERLAITLEQVRQWNLAPISKNDRRYLDGGGHDAWETEALGQLKIVQIVRRRLDELLPEPLDSVHERQEEERASARRRLGRRQS